MTRKTTTVMLENAECAGGSARTVEKVIREVPGVLRAHVNPGTEAAYVEYDADRCSETDLVDAVESLGIRSVHTAPQRAPQRTPRRTPSRRPAAITVPSQRRPMRDTGTRSRTWWAFAGFIAIAGFFLFTEHRAHLFGVLPFLFLLACPFLHRFGHGGHGGHGGNDGGHATDAQEGDARDRDQAARAGNYEQSFRGHQHVPGANRDDGRG